MPITDWHLQKISKSQTVLKRLIFDCRLQCATEQRYRAKTGWTRQQGKTTVHCWQGRHYLHGVTWSSRKMFGVQERAISPRFWLLQYNLKMERPDWREQFYSFPGAVDCLPLNIITHVGIESTSVTSRSLQATDIEQTTTTQNTLS